MLLFFEHFPRKCFSVFSFSNSSSSVPLVNQEFIWSEERANARKRSGRPLGKSQRGGLRYGGSGEFKREDIREELGGGCESG